MNCHTFRKSFIDQWSLGHDPMHNLDLSAHASTCAECSRFANQMLQTITALGSSPNIQAPEGYKEKVMKQFLATQQASNFEAQPQRRRFARLRWTAAVAMLAVIVILAGLIPKYGGTSLAFAQVVQRIQEIQTLFYQTERTPEPGGSRTDAYRYYYKAPNFGRMEWTPSGVVQIFDKQARKQLHIYPKTKTYFYEENVLPGFNFNMLGRIAEIKTSTVETLPEKELAGHKVVGFKAPLDNNPTTMVTIWADVETGNPVQVESKHTDGSVHVKKDFQINVPLEDALFSFTPPEGYTRRAKL